MKAEEENEVEVVELVLVFFLFVYIKLAPRGCELWVLIGR